jgi:NADH-quinone oxidoreductase subunit J
MVVTLNLILWCVLAGAAIATGLAVVLVRNPIYCALSLIVNFFLLAVMYLILRAEFLAAIQVIVYAGAIMVLFLFVIMLLNLGGEETKDKLRALRAPAFLLGIILLVEVVAALRYSASFRVNPPFPTFYPFVQPELYGGVREIGRLLFTDYLLPFEATTVLLLIAVVGAVVLGKKGPS